MHRSSSFLLLWLSLLLHAIARPGPAQWVVLNTTVGGRLFEGVPLAKPCYTDPTCTECTVIANNYTNGNLIAQHYGGFQQVQWGSCQATGEGCTLDAVEQIDPSSIGDARCYQGSISNYYIDVRSIADIQTGLAFAEQHSIPIAIKNSGHDYKGRSSAPNSLALWVHNLRAPITLTEDFVPEGCSEAAANGVTFQTGEDFASLFAFAAENNITIVGGSSDTVAPAGGWISGGGHGALSNVFGLGVDNALQIRAVLPNGTYITANKCQNPDLWFALRGGGGASFGVIVEMTTRANPNVVLQVAVVSFQSTQVTARNDFLGILIANANKWAFEGWGGYLSAATNLATQTSSLILLTPLLSTKDATASMDPVTSFVANLTDARVIANSVSEIPTFYEAYQRFIQPNAIPVGASIAIGSRLIPDSQFGGSKNQNHLREALIEICNMINQPDEAGLVDAGQILIIAAAPTSYPVNAGNDTSSIHPAWRDALWHVVIESGFDNNASAAQISSAFSTAHQATDVLASLLPGGGGAYQNEADVFEPNPASTFWGHSHYNRLLAIKRAVDPANILTGWQQIGWDSSDERYSCYPSI